MSRLSRPRSRKRRQRPGRSNTALSGHLLQRRSFFVPAVFRLAACAVAALGGRDVVAVRTSAERAPGGAGADYSLVLHRYCDASLVREYESLSAQGQSRMLSALGVTVEEMAKTALVGKTMLGRVGAEPADPTCPIAKALGRLWTLLESQGITAEFTRALAQQVLPSWGVAKPNLVYLTRHNAGLARRASKSTRGYFDSNNAVTKLAAACAHNWAALASIGVGDLSLFQVASGKMLSGMLVVDPIPTVGIMTLLEDDHGTIVELGLYNQLPGGLTGAAALEVARQMFPRGRRLQIAEPYLKVFMDGNRGVRVDDPADVRIEHIEGDASTLSAARLEGNACVERMQYPAAAAAYWRGLRASAQDVAALLSNRAQARLKQERWVGALVDAAGATLLEPQGAKHWWRYGQALDGLGLPELAARTRFVRGGEPACAPTAPARRALRAALAQLLRSEKTLESGSVAELKERGNTAFRAGHFEEAERLYTAAISACPSAEHAAAILSNLALCGLNTSTLHDAVATSIASLALRVSIKPLYRCAKALALLGEVALAEHLLASADDAMPARLAKDWVATRRTLGDEIAMARAALSTDATLTGLRAALSANSVIFDWFAEDAIELADFGRKGRGLRTRREVHAGEVLIVQRPRGQGIVDGGQALLMVTNSMTRRIDDASTAQLKAALTSAVRSDALLASTLAALHTGRGACPPKVPLEALFDRLSPSVLPLLPQHPDFFPAAELHDLGSQRVADVVEVNCHGSTKASLRALEAFDFEGHLEVKEATSLAAKWMGGGSTALFPAIALLNHARAPTCANFPLVQQGRLRAMAIIAMAPLPAGAELTIRYLDDLEAVERKWGIVE